MFAYCLLPTLLLLTAVVSADVPPVLTTEISGSQKGIVSSASETFGIPDGQCYGVLDISKQERLRCPKNWGLEAGWVEVTVHDYTPVKIAVQNLNNVKVERLSSCNSKAIVNVKMGCKINHKNPLSAARKVLLPA